MEWKMGYKESCRGRRWQHGSIVLEQKFSLSGTESSAATESDQLVFIVVFVVFFGYSEAKRASHASLCTSSSEVAAAKVLQIGRVDGPVVALAV
jgi:hypothetical protein